MPANTKVRACLSVAILFLSSVALADLNSSSNLSNANPSSSAPAAAGSGSQASKADTAGLNKLISQLYQAEADGNTSEVATRTEDVRRYLIKLKAKGVSLSLNPTKFSSTKDLTKQLDGMATKKTAGMGSLKKIGFACAVATMIIVNSIDVARGNCDASMADVDQGTELSAPSAGGSAPIH